MSFSTKLKKSAMASAIGLAVASVGASAITVVTNGNDMGEGSLRAALASGDNEIVVATDQDIMVMSPLTYTGSRPLTLTGTGQTISTMEDINILETSTSTTVVGLNFQGPGGFSIENQSAMDNPGKGIFVDVPDDQTGTIRLTLRDVAVRDVANHGVHVSDCNLADDCGSGGGGAGDGSPASIRVDLFHVTIENVGKGKQDADGLRVDERSTGSIIVNADMSDFILVGADGMELDEGQEGSVVANVTKSTFNGNGDYCDPALLGPALEEFLGGEPDEGEFEDSDGVTEADIPGPPMGFLDDICIEYAVDFYESGNVEAYEYAIDTDDGFDIDEAGDGTLVARIYDSEISANLDEGIDFDEEGAGSIITIFAGTTADDNSDDGYKMSEEDAGAVIGSAASATAMNNGGKGFVYEEEGVGNVEVELDGVMTAGNDDGDVGVEAVQEDTGVGSLTTRNSDIADGFELEGVDLIEE